MKMGLGIATALYKKIKVGRLITSALKNYCRLSISNSKI
jgi:hypothetical protein